MLDVAPTELAMVAVVALVVIGPKDLPRVMRVVGRWTGRARAMAKTFRAGIDDMIRESELKEMEEKWRLENERIMREHPSPSAEPSPAYDEPPPDHQRPRGADDEPTMMPLPPQPHPASPELPLGPPADPKP